MLPRRRVEFLFQEIFKRTHCAHILEITVLKCFRKDGKDEVSFGDLIQHTDSVCKFINHTEKAEFTFPEHASQLLALERECIRMLSCPFINMSDELIDQSTHVKHEFRINYYYSKIKVCGMAFV